MLLLKICMHKGSEFLGLQYKAPGIDVYPMESEIYLVDSQGDQERWSIL
jgi:hypothetical protein